MNCLKCGAEPQPNDKFCRKCGSALYPEPEREYIPSPNRPAKGPPWWAVAIGVVGLCCILFFIFQLLIGLNIIRESFTHPSGDSAASQNPSPPSDDQASALTGPHLRIYKAGDSWNFNVTINGTRPDGSANNGSGTDYQGIFQETLGGTSGLAKQSINDLAFDDGKRAGSGLHLYFQQDDAGNFTETAEDSGSTQQVQKLAQAQLIYPGDWTNSTSVNANLTFPDGSTQTVDTTIQPGEVSESLPDGRKTDCWSVTQVITTSNGTSANWSGLFSPSLGNYVNFTQTVTSPIAGTFTAAGTLVAYHLE